MRVKIPRREIILFCSALLFPVASLCAQEVGQEVKEVRQDVEQLQQDVRELREEVRRLQEELHGFRRNSFPQCGMDTVAPYVPHRFIHRLGIEARPQYVFPTNPFLQGENERWKPIQSSFAAHLKYSFKFRPNTCADRLYGGAYQGFGLAVTTFGDRKQLGDPVTFYHRRNRPRKRQAARQRLHLWPRYPGGPGDRKSTRLNSSHIGSSRMPSSA